MSWINMVRKDLVAYRKTLVWCAVYLLIFPLCFRSLGSQGSYVMVIALAVYITTVGTIQSDEKNKVNYLICTLPVKRSAVVGGKLLLLDATLLFGLLLYAVLGSLNILLFKDVIIFELPGLQTICGAAFASSFLGLIFIPMAYKLDSNRGRMAGAILIILIIVLASVGGGIFAVMLQDEPIGAALAGSAAMQYGVPAAMVAGAVIFQCLTYAITLHIYKKKDF